MTENELKAAAVGIITYCYMMQTGEPPTLDVDDQIVEAGAILLQSTLSFSRHSLTRLLRYVPLRTWTPLNSLRRMTIDWRRIRQEKAA